jgi:glycosyltransferase involved in cell wall biosynthesis
MTVADLIAMPAARGGGVEALGWALAAGLEAAGTQASVRAGRRGILGARCEHRLWSMTWKTDALTRVSPCVRPSRRSVFIHGAELTRDDGLASRLRKFILPRCDEMIAVSPYVFALTPTSIHGRIRLVGPVVPDLYFSDPKTPDRELAPDGRARLILSSVGRLVKRKGHHDAIKVARILSASRYVELHIIGMGPAEQELRSLARIHSTDNLKVIVHGWVSDEQKATLLKATDVLLFLPRKDAGEFEGLGLVPFEAAAAGVPSVVRDCGGTVFSVVDGVTGILVTSNDAEIGPVVAGAVERLVAERWEFGRGARAWAEGFRSGPWICRVLDDSAAQAQGLPSGWVVH